MGLRPLGAVLVLLALVACGAARDVSSAPPRAPAPAALSQPTAADVATCDGAPYLRLIGQNGTALERELILREVRIVRQATLPGDVRRPTRLNFLIDDATGLIVNVACG